MNYKNLNPQAFKEGLAANKDIVLLDVRTPREIAEGAIKGALSIDFFAPDFEKNIKNLDTNKTYYIYCRSGNRSGQACQLMSQLGFKDLVNLDGGMMAWQN